MIEDVETVEKATGGEMRMTNEAVIFVLIITIFVFSVWLACGIQSLSKKIDRIEAIINYLKHKQEGQ